MALWRYPVKSLLGERVAASEVGECGLTGDRRFGLIDRKTGFVASAKNPRRWPDLFKLSACYPDGTDGPARITLPDGIHVATDDPRASAMVSEALGRDVQLASTAPDQPTLEQYIPSIEDVDPPEEWEQVYQGRFAQRSPAGTFSDSSPIHIVTTATLDALANATTGVRVDARRFRPNIVVETTEKGFIENDWVDQTITIGGVQIFIRAYTARCVMVTLPQSDLENNPEVLRAAAKRNRLPKNSTTEPCAGVYGLVRRAGTIAVGDRVEPA